MDSIKWKIISSMFEENPNLLTSHHLDSYNDFYKNGIFQIFKEKNPIEINSIYDEKKKDFRHKCLLYFGGKDADKIYFGKPVIYDKNTELNAHYMFPNEARLRNMNYSMTIHYDIDVEFIDILEDGEMPFPVGNQELAEDYTEEIENEKKKKEGNFKKNTKYDVDDDSSEDGEYDAIKKTGGAPKKDAKDIAEKKRKVKSVQVEMTTGMAKELRETYEKSMIGKNIQRRTSTIEKVFLGKFPIMVQSDFCILSGLPRETRFSMGECKNDIGGYFIIDGKEKTIVPQEKFADNMLYIKKSTDDKFLYSAEIRSVSENVSKPIRTLSVKLLAPSSKYTFNNIVVNIPNVRNPVPLFIVFRALGVISDKEIIKYCLLDLEKYEDMIENFVPSIHDAGGVLTQRTALQYIATLTKHSTITYTLEILSDYFLPHIGETNFKKKALYLGYIVFRLLLVHSGLDNPTDRDHFKYKRIELVGSLLYDLFREYYTLQQREYHLGFEKKLYYNREMYESNLFDLIQQNSKDIFRERVVELGFKKAYKGNWGSQAHTKRIGVIQDLNRLSFNSTMTHLRKTNLPLDSSAKLVGPRVLHGSHWGFMDPIDTPDGGNIGLHKSLAISTLVSRNYSREHMIKWLFENTDISEIEKRTTEELSRMTKVFVNEFWCGSIDEPLEMVDKILIFRRNGLVPIQTSVSFDIKLNTIFIYTDAGRVCRPVYFFDKKLKRFSFENLGLVVKGMKAQDKNYKESDIIRWKNITLGFNSKRPHDSTKFYKLGDLYDVSLEETKMELSQIERFQKYKAVVEYIDPNETETALIQTMTDYENQKLVNTEERNVLKKQMNYSHLEIHESLIFGIMCNQINFPENNPPTRNAFSCGQSKQAVSMYHTNYQVRMDKTAVILNYGQIQLIKTKYLKHIHHEENVNGINAIVAIMCYTGYNVEDAILINEGAIKRGLFNTTYMNTYETHEERSSVGGEKSADKRFTNIESVMDSIVGTKPGYDYSLLDEHGIIKENTPVDDKTVLIGLTNRAADKIVDASKVPKKGQIGVVDKSFITEGEEGERIAKVRLREVRIPAIGDKMASLHGQKGTVGLVIPEKDMPFTKDGLIPDMIINPHAIPSRMTIGHLIECITGKTCCLYGGFGDSTAFNNKGSKVEYFGKHLVKENFHSSGCEILYNGMTGEQIESQIYIGPTYYMRLKHMVKDKINYRARGPRTALTRQPVSGRANDGGLRVGEMERDVIISHGITNFLKESMMERGDIYYAAVCNETGMMAIYNPARKLFMSPAADGPVKFIESTVVGENAETRQEEKINIQNITKFGRNFSVICIPYCFKLLLQELQTMNIQMRVITEDNIDQFNNMAYSNNILKLTNLNSIQQVVENIRKTVLNKKETKLSITPKPETPSSSNASQKIELEDIQDDFDDIFSETRKNIYDTSPTDADYSPPYAPDNSPTQSINLGAIDLNYDTVSPPFIPGQEEEKEDNISFYDNSIGQTPSLQTKKLTGGNETTYSAAKLPLKAGGRCRYNNMEHLIKTISLGNNFCTIVPKGNNGYLEDQSMVVHMNDLIPYQEQPLQSFFKEDVQSKRNTVNLNETPAHPNININPIIKIINGPDNSLETGESNRNMKMLPNQLDNTNSFLFRNTDSGVQRGSLLPSSASMANIINEIIPIENKPIINDDPNKINFDKIVIKKLG